MAASLRIPARHVVCGIISIGDPFQLVVLAAFGRNREMRKYRTAFAYLIGIGCGVAYIYILAQLFGRVLVRNPINQWLIEKLAKTGHDVGYNIAIYSHDFLVYLIVALPFAVVLSRLPPRNSWKYLLVALATSLVLQYWVPITDPSALIRLAELWQFYIGLGMSILGLPFAFAAVSVVSRKGTTPTEVGITNTGIQ